MRLEVSDSHHHRLAAVSTLHVLVPRDELEYAMCQVYSMRVGASRSLTIPNTVGTRLHRVRNSLVPCHIPIYPGRGRDPIASRPQFIGPLPHPMVPCHRSINRGRDAIGSLP